MLRLIQAPHFENCCHRTRTGLAASSVSPGEAGRDALGLPTGLCSWSLPVCTCVGHGRSCDALSDHVWLTSGSWCSHVPVHTCGYVGPEGGAECVPLKQRRDLIRQRQWPCCAKCLVGLLRIPPCAGGSVGFLGPYSSRGGVCCGALRTPAPESALGTAGSSPGQAMGQSPVPSLKQATSLCLDTCPLLNSLCL